MSCTVDKRKRADRLAAHLRADERVVGVDRLDPATEPTNRWAVEATLSRRCDGFPTDALYCLGFPVTIRDVSPQGTYHRAVLLL